MTHDAQISDLQRLKALGERDPNKLAQFMGEMARHKDVKRLLPVVDKLGRMFRKHSAVQEAIGEVFAVAKNTSKAATYAKRAADLEPKNPRRLVNLALNLLANGQEGDAKEAISKVSKLASDEPKLFGVVASVYFRLNDFRQAASFYEKAIEFDPDNATHHYSLAAVQRFLGELDKAEESFDRAIELNPKEYEAYYIRSDLRRQTTEKNHTAELEKILATDIEPYQGEVFLSFALAKEYEDLKSYEKSFAYLKRGADLRRKHLQYQVEADETIFDEIIGSFTSAALDRAPSGHPTSEPIFLMGMPRTGTTLLERILSSHSSVISAGELPNFSREMVRLLGEANKGQNLTPLQRVKKSLELDMDELGRSYLESTRTQTGETPFFIDKLPFNYLNVGLIHLALPTAKLIHMTRHPMDTCYAVYKTLFQRAYPFSYDLDDLGRYFIAYHNLMAHWHSLLGNKILTVAYEDLVASPEQEARRVLNHCGLDWEPEVLDFHESQEASTTASASQVRQPIYQSSVQKWRHFETELAPLKERLYKAGILVD